MRYAPEHYVKSITDIEGFYTLTEKIQHELKSCLTHGKYFDFNKIKGKKELIYFSGFWLESDHALFPSIFNIMDPNQQKQWIDDNYSVELTKYTKISSLNHLLELFCISSPYSCTYTNDVLQDYKNTDIIRKISKKEDREQVNIINTLIKAWKDTKPSKQIINLVKDLNLLVSNLSDETKLYEWEDISGGFSISNINKHNCINKREIPWFLLYNKLNTYPTRTEVKDLFLTKDKKIISLIYDLNKNLNINEMLLKHAKEPTFINHILNSEEQSIKEITVDTVKHLDLSSIENKNIKRTIQKQFI